MRKILSALVLMSALSVPAYSAGTEEPATEAASLDFTSVKAKLEKNDYKAAIDELNTLSAAGPNADVFNYLGYASRKDGQLDAAAIYYIKALELKPDHKGALEYQGEMFVIIGKMDDAKANLAKLVTLCPDGCEERKELEEVLAKVVTN